MVSALAGLAAYQHGWGSLGSTIAHAAIWSVIGRLIWHAPAVAVVAAFAVAAVWLLMRGRSDGRS